MKRTVSISLGSPSRDKRVVVDLNGVQISDERIGTGSDAQAAWQRSRFMLGWVAA